MLPTAIRGLLFDKDGTLLDYARTWIPINHELASYAAGGDQALARRLLQIGGHDPDTDIVVPGSLLAAGPHDELVEVFGKAAGDRMPADFSAVAMRLFREGGGKYAVLLPGVAEAIHTLAARGYRLGIATNDTEDGLMRSMQRVGLLDAFPFRAGCDSGHGAKPGPGMVRAFCAATGLAPAEVAVIGDSVHDFAMGRAAGVGCNIGVLCGTSGRADLEAKADLILDDVPALLPLARGPKT
jgi:phosphoglycolate phosphatase